MLLSGVMFGTGKGLEKPELLEVMPVEFNDGRSMSLYRRAVASMPENLIDDAINEAREVEKPKDQLHQVLYQRVSFKFGR